MWYVLCWLMLDPGDAAVIGQVRRESPSIETVRIWNRLRVNAELDLVAALGAPKSQMTEEYKWIWWSPEHLLVILLQERRRPERLYRIAAKTGFADCEAKLERMTATDLVISCTPEKGWRGPSQKFVYDIRAKALVKEWTLDPVAGYRIFASGEGAVFTGGSEYVANPQQRRAVAFEWQPGREPEFQLLDGDEAKRWINKGPAHRYNEPFREILFGPENQFRLTAIDGDRPPVAIVEGSGANAQTHQLPQSTYDQFAVARPARVRDGYVREGTTIAETMAAWQVEGDRLWFGKAFYDGEGSTGIGGFGYFDAVTRKFRIWSPEAIRPSSISAMLVEDGEIWMSLVHSGEWRASSRGLARFDRATEQLAMFDFPDIAGEMLRVGDRILVATEFGAAIIRRQEGRTVIQRYFVDEKTDGRLRIAEAAINRP